jgi:hypothetical protein
MQYLMSVIDNTLEFASDDEMEAITAFNRRLRDNGHFVLANGLSDPATAIVIDNRSNAKEERPGTLFTGPEHYSGCWIIECDSPALARELAYEASLCCNRKVELRAFHG